MVPPLATTCSSWPGRIPTSFRISFGITTWYFGETRVRAIRHPFSIIDAQKCNTYSPVPSINSTSTTGLIVLSTSGFPKTSTVHYADSSTDIGLTLSLGAGLDVRMSEALSGRILIDFYAPASWTAATDYRSSGVRPVRLAMRARMRGPSSS